MDQKKIIILVIAAAAAILLLSSFGTPKSKPVEVKESPSGLGAVFSNPLSLIQNADGSIDWTKLFYFSPVGPLRWLNDYSKEGESARRDALLNEAYSKNWFKSAQGLEGQGWKQFVNGTMPPEKWPALLAETMRYKRYVDNPSNFASGTKERVIKRYQSVAKQIADTVQAAIVETANL